MRISRMPVVRNYVTGRPVANAVRPINRSDVVRLIFHQKGNISNNAVLAMLMRQGLEVHPSVINRQRIRMFPPQAVILPFAEGGGD